MVINILTINQDAVTSALVAANNQLLYGAISSGMSANSICDLCSFFNLSFDNSTDSDSTNITSLETLTFAYNNGMIDYVLFRDTLKTIYQNRTVWNALDVPTQTTLVILYIYPSDFSTEEFNALRTVDEQAEDWNILVDNCTNARGIRWNTLKNQLSYISSTIDGFNFFVDTKAFKNDYIDANLPTLVMWFNNQANSALGLDYTTTGFASQSYYSSNKLTIANNILIYGNYTT